MFRLAASAVAILLAHGTPFSTFACGVALHEFSRLSVFSGMRRAAAFAGPLMLGAGLWLGGTPYARDPAGLYDTVVRALYDWLGLITLPTMREAGAVLVVAAALFWPPFRYVLRGRFCDFLGKVSFMLYLVQIPTLGTVGGAVFIVAANRLPYVAATLVALACYIAATLIVAAVLTRLLDRPAIRLSRRAAAALDAALARLSLRTGAQTAATPTTRSGLGPA